MPREEYLPSVPKTPSTEEILEYIKKIQKTDGTRYIPASDWNKYHPWPPMGGLRHLIFYADQNGFAEVITRVGRRVILSEKKFFEYMEKQNAKTKK